MKQVGERLGLAMKARGVSKQMAFAIEVGVSESMVSRWKRGDGLSLSSAMRICQMLDISLDWLLLGRGEMDGHRPQKRFPLAEKQDWQAAADGLPDPVVDAIIKLAAAIRSTQHPDRR